MCAKCLHFNNLFMTLSVCNFISLLQCFRYLVASKQPVVSWSYECDTSAFTREKHTFFFNVLKHAFSVLPFNVSCEFSALNTLALLFTVFTVYSYWTTFSYSRMYMVYNIFRFGIFSISTLYLVNSEIQGFNLLSNEFELNYFLGTTCVLNARRSGRYYNILWWFLCGCSASMLLLCCAAWLLAAAVGNRLAYTVNGFVPVGSGVGEDATTACHVWCLCVKVCVSQSCAKLELEGMGSNSSDSANYPL